LAIWRGLTARARAIELFSQLHVWDTEENSGVLIYVQFVDHKVEIVADRGIASKVEHATWREVCAAMERAFKAGRYEEGVLGALAEPTGCWNGTSRRAGHPNDCRPPAVSEPAAGAPRRVEKRSAFHHRAFARRCG